MARRQVELSNDVAAELAGSHDAILRALEEHLSAGIFLRGNVVTLDGDAEAVQAAATVVRELSDLVERGHEIGPATIESVARVLDQSESPSKVLEDVVWRHRNVKVAPKSVNQKRYVDAIRRSTVTFGVGPAGTGKTFLAMAMATAALSRREVNRIILTRPAVEAGERLGFLPGDLMAKVDPYLRPLFDALHDMMDPERVATHLERGVIEVAPLAFMRGRTLNDSFVILDEAQNTSPEQMKMFLTRLGFGSRMVVTGDITQIDLPREQQSGLVVVGDILDGVDGVEFVRFGGEDVVRHKLVQRIVAAYDEHSVAPGARACGRRRPTSPPARVSGLEVEVLGDALDAEQVRRACVLAAASAGVDEGHVAVSFVDAEAIARLNAEHRGKARPDGRAVLPRRRRRRDRRAAGAARARRRGDLPGAHARPHRGRRPRRAAPRGHGPRDGRGRDAGPAGGDRRRGSADHPLGLRRARRAAQRRQVDAGQRDGRPQGRDRVGQAPDDPPRDPRRGDARRRADGARSTCRACSARATSSRAACSTASSRRSGRPTPR